ncbi:methyltransferase [Pseudonocardia ailaonensis]|uniref:Methyltransferase n=1 Tax=Pseudonocardia ailaonensis TaxID=367279 RepID=A0ABN2MT95_9PSEU
MLSDSTCARLRDALLAAGYTTTGVRELLGPGAHAALTRGELEAPARATREAGGLGSLVRLFLLGGTEAAPPLPEIDALVEGGLLTRAPDGLRAAMDLRPYGEEETDWFVLSDLDTPASRQDRDHVTGVGGASLTLASSLVRTPVADTLDLGTGCGVQALHASRFSTVVTATDVAPRALATARATLALSGITNVELAEGPWLEPVAGRTFDAIVSNPPFVPGPARVDYVYRDSGQAGDAALAGLLRDLPSRLRPGGRAQLLGSWLHVRGEDWPERVRSWIPPGCDAWIVQREVTDPALHVGTWQRDAGLDLTAPSTRAQAAEWLDWLEAERVEAVGFGFLLLRVVPDGRSPEIVIEDLPGELADPLHGEMAGWLERVAWLRDHPSDDALLGARFRLSPSATLEHYSVAGSDGWSEAGAAVVLADGPQWRHEVDEPAAALLAGCSGALPLEELVALLSFAHDRPADELVRATLPAVREFVRHGVLLPA